MVNIKIPKTAQSTPNTISQVTKRLTFLILTITDLQIHGFQGIQVSFKVKEDTGMVPVKKSSCTINQNDRIYIVFAEDNICICFMAMREKDSGRETWLTFEGVP